MVAGTRPVLLPSDPGLNLRELPFTLGIVGRPGTDTGPKDDDDCSPQ